MIKAKGVEVAIPTTLPKTKEKVAGKTITSPGRRIRAARTSRAIRRILGNPVQMGRRNRFRLCQPLERMSRSS